MKSPHSIPLVERDGELLNTERANAFIKAINRLAAMTVKTVRTAGMAKSELMVSEENAVLALSYRDAAKVLGNAATIDLVTPYSGKFAFRTQNGRNGSGGTIDVNSDGVVTVRPPARSGGVGARKTLASVKVKVGGSQKTASGGYIKTADNGWVLFASFVVCYDVTPEYRSKTSTYTLCGFSEFTSPSTPPKKYLLNQIIEDFVWCTYSSSACSGTAARFQLSMNGTATYTASTCTLATIDDNRRNDIGICGTPASGFTTTQRSRLVYDPAFMELPTNLPTVREVTARPPCYNFSVGNYVTATGSGSETLSSEDTEDDAIARANALVGWDGTAATVAKSDTRGAGDFSGSYVYVEWRAPISGLTAGLTYSAKARYGRRAYGSSDPFVFFAEGSVSFTATGGSEYTPYEAIPNESGYETNVISARVCLGA